MELPIQFKNVIEEMAENIPVKKLISASNSISERYRSEAASGKSLITNNTEALAYAIVRMPATIGAVGNAMQYTRDRYDGEISSVLDIGAGTGACCWAASEIFPDIENVTCLEREKNMIDLGKSLMDKGDFPCEYNWISRDITEGFEQKADLVTASYVLNEMPDAKREKLVSAMWNAAEKLLIIIEPGTPKGFSNLLKIREHLIKSGANIIAPCPHSDKCPLPQDDWCHFTARVSRTKLHKQLKGGEVPYEDEKFCYIAASKESCEPCRERVLRHPKIESGKITLKLCSENGISEKIVTKKDGPLFKKARKADCGDEL